MQNLGVWSIVQVDRTFQNLNIVSIDQPASKFLHDFQDLEGFSENDSHATIIICKKKLAYAITASISQCMRS